MSMQESAEERVGIGGVAGPEVVGIGGVTAGSGSEFEPFLFMKRCIRVKLLLILLIQQRRTRLRQPRQHQHRQQTTINTTTP